MRENLIIILLTVTHGILQKIMLKFFFLSNSIIQIAAFKNPSTSRPPTLFLPPTGNTC